MDERVRILDLKRFCAGLMRDSRILVVAYCVIASKLAVAIHPAVGFAWLLPMLGLTAASYLTCRAVLADRWAPAAAEFRTGMVAACGGFWFLLAILMVWGLPDLVSKIICFLMVSGAILHFSLNHAKVPRVLVVNAAPVMLGMLSLPLLEGNPAQNARPAR